MRRKTQEKPETLTRGTWAARRLHTEDMRNMASRKTASYEIKTYEEKFIEEQARIGSEATKHWTQYRQTPAEELRKTYSGLGFDPSTRFYALVKGALVGYLTASLVSGTPEKTAVMRLPLVKKGHEGAQKALMDHALKVLKERGISVVTTEVGKGWGNWETLLKQYKFEDAGVSQYLAEKNISSIDFSHLPAAGGVEQYERGKDRDVFGTMLAGLGFPVERVKLLMDQYESGAKDSYFRRVAVFRKDNKTVAASAMTVPDNEPDVARVLRVMMVPGVDLSDVGGRIIRRLIEAGAKDGLKRFRMTLLPDNVKAYNDLFSRLGVAAAPFINTYRKRL